MLTVTLLGTGSPLPDPNRAGPATLVTGGDEQYLVDAGRGVLMRLAAAGSAASRLSAVLLTHLHSDHITDLNDVITSRWVMTFERTPLTIVGPVGTKAVVDHILASLDPDIGYRMAHHDDLDHPPPVDASIAYRFDAEETAVVVAGDTVPCPGLDRLAAGANALVHTAIRKDVIKAVPIQRMVDILDYHSSPEEAAQTAQRAGVRTLVLTHYVPPFPSGAGDDWRALASAHFDGTIELGDDLHRVEIG